MPYSPAAAVQVSRKADVYAFAVTIRQCLGYPGLDMTQLRGTPGYKRLQGMLKCSLDDDPAARPEMGELVSLLKDLEAELELEAAREHTDEGAQGS